MHPICQQTIITHFTNSELQRHAMDVDALLADPVVRKFVNWAGDARIIVTLRNFLPDYILVS